MKRKIILRSMLTMTIVAMLVCLTSCSKDKEEGKPTGVSGLYYYSIGGSNASRTAYNFVNGNTVEIYGALSSNPNSKWGDEKGVSFPLRSGWYYSPGNKNNYTYTIVDNKIILTNGNILTINGENLMMEGTSIILNKWN